MTIPSNAWKRTSTIFILVLFAFFVSIGANKTTTIQYISPVPNSKMVSAETNILLRTIGTLDPSQEIDSAIVLVDGSVSGRHQGRVTVSDDNETIIFTPNTPFTPDEFVSVNLRSGIKTREGFTIKPLFFSFKISLLTSHDQKQILESIESSIGEDDIQTKGKIETPLPPYNKENTQNDVLPSDFPEIKVITSNNPSPGNIFLGSFKISQAGSHFQFLTLVPSDKQYIMILDNNGKPIFYRRTGSSNYDFKVQPNGHLSYFDDSLSAFCELDTNYIMINKYSAGNGYQTDPHAFKILPNGHVIFLCKEIQTMDMSTIVTGGKTNTTVVGIVIQELDKNKNVVFQWRTFDHFKITDALHEDLTESIIDYVHANAIDIHEDGNILISSRHLDEITKIDRNTGDIIWRWGGKNNQFTFVNDSLHFFHQHSIRRLSTDSYILFDNGNFRLPEFSRAVEYKLDENTKTATLIWQYRHTPDIFSVAMASVQRLLNGNTLIGWGTAKTALTEVRPDGSTALEIQLPDSIVSYRAWRSIWPLHSTGTFVPYHPNENMTFALHQNYPNPFNPSTTIQFDLPRQSYVSLKIYDLLGRIVATLIEGKKSAGNYSVPFNASMLSSGMYLSVLKVTLKDKNGESIYTATRKMVLNK